MIEKHINDRLVNDTLFYSENYTCTKELDELYWFLFDEYCHLEHGKKFPNIVYTNAKPLKEQIENAKTFDYLCVCDILFK